MGEDKQFYEGELLEFYERVTRAVGADGDDTYTVAQAVEAALATARRPAKTWVDLSCGACGGADHRLQTSTHTRAHGSHGDIRTICQKCANVTHIMPGAPLVRLGWGRSREGEVADGLLVEMAWPDRGKK